MLLRWPLALTLGTALAPVKSEQLTAEPCEGDAQSENLELGNPDSEHGEEVESTGCWTAGRTLEACCLAKDGPQQCWPSARRSIALSRRVPGYLECCPNSDCWAAGYSFNSCCGPEFGPAGNPDCWAGSFDHGLCCKGDGGLSWPAELFGPEPQSYERLYSVENFYTDGQYGPDFGYYSTGRVLRPATAPDPSNPNGWRNTSLRDGGDFAHFTTFPMAISPHFARHACRMLLLAWVSLGSPKVLRVLELGAGSGRLGADIRRCVIRNEIEVPESQALQDWQRAVRYATVERSPALAARQRRRGLRVFEADAQEPGVCQDLHTQFRQVHARRKLADDPEEVDNTPGVILSNELIDAFAPAKLRLMLGGRITYAGEELQSRGWRLLDCEVWQESRVVHLIPLQDLIRIYTIMEMPLPVAQMRAKALETSGEDFACAVVRSSSVGRAVEEVLAGDVISDPPSDHSCLAAFLAIGSLPGELDLRLPFSAHELRRRLLRDEKVRRRLRRVLSEKAGPMAKRASAVLMADDYRKLRQQVRGHPLAELELIKTMETWKVASPISDSRCQEIIPWAKRNERQLQVQSRLFRQLGYSSMDVLVRFGEEGFMKLADCLLPGGGFMLSIDYGANFDALVHSSAVSGDDNIVPPMYEIPEGSKMPDCHTEWSRCAGLIDWTTFVDFTNMALAGKQYGWRPVYYGPQNALEELSPRDLKLTSGEWLRVPGYFTLRQAGFPSLKSSLGRSIADWYGRAVSGGQRWAGFKVF